MLISLPSIAFEGVQLALSSVDVATGEENPSSGITLEGSDIYTEITYSTTINSGIF